MIIFTKPTKNCSCSALHTDLECPTHGEAMKRSLQRDAIERAIDEELARLTTSDK